MKLSLNWLKEYVPLPADLTPEKIAYDLTMTTVEVESCESPGESLEGIVVGKINALRPHPNADRLRITTTDVGGEEKQIVCGGSNLREGMLVAVAKPGSRVRWHGEGDLVELKETKIRGEASFGMICSAVEIGLESLYPAREEKEIVDLSDLDAAPGTPLAVALGLDDIIIEIDNKSLTNRPDLWGHYGIARELAAIYSLPLSPLPQVTFPTGASKVKVTVHEPELCRRYSAAVLENVTAGESPQWMQRRLASVGQRPISLLVDLTNYVMFAVGQPTHAFDARELTASAIHIRRAKRNESLELLDGAKLELSPEMLVIADETRAVALAGIKGGLASGVRDDTSTVVLESANFSGVHVRKTATTLGLRTESSMRFDKELDTDRPVQASALFVHLLKEIQPAVRLVSFVDEFPRPQPAVSVQVRREFISGRVGRDFTTQEIHSLLERFGFAVKADGEKLTIAVPAWRATGDVSIPADIVEEVARLYGYDTLEFIAPPIELTAAVRQPRYDVDVRMRELLSSAGGMFEVFNYPWGHESLFAAAGFADAPALMLQDPPSPETARIVTSLIPNLLGAAERNLRHETDFGLFEIARVFHPADFRPWSTEAEKLPRQPKHVAGLLVGSSPKEIFLRLKGILEETFSALPIEPVVLTKEGTFSAWTARGGQLALRVGKEQIGELAVVSPRTLRALGTPRAAIAAFELSFDALKCLPATPGRYRPIPKFPQVEFDLSMLFEQTVPWEQIRMAASGADERVREVRFADEYQGEQIPAGKRAVALKMLFCDPAKTLTSEETQQIAAKVAAALEKRAGASKRER